MGQNLDEGKKSAVYPYYQSPPHVNMIMISSTFQMLNYCMIESTEYRSHISFGDHEYKRI